MQCPQCGARTEVSETRDSFRDRRCTNAACRLDFTTNEQVISQRQQTVKPREHTRLCARTRATQLETPRRPRAPGAEAVGTSHPDHGAPPDEREIVSAAQEKPSCLEPPMAA